MIEFKVTGETWKEILKKLEGMWIHTTHRDTAPLSKDPVIETVEEPTNEFGPEVKIPKKWDTEKLPAGERPTYKIPQMKTEVVPPPILPPSSSPVYNVPGMKLDSAGHPWNPDVHTRTKAINEDGTWRNKRKTPGFEKRSGPVKPEPGKVATPSVPPSLRIDDLPKFALYATKINTEKNLKDNIIRDYLISIGIPNILQIPEEKLPEVAETLKTHFGVEF